MWCSRRRRPLPLAPAEPCSTTAAGKAHPGDRESQNYLCSHWGSCREKLVSVDIETQNQDTLPLLFVGAIILCRCLRNTEQTTHKVTSFQVWIHSRTVVDNYQHLVICSRTFSQHLHHGHVGPSGAVGWHRERLSWDCAALTHPQPVSAPGRASPALRRACPGLWDRLGTDPAGTGTASPSQTN